MQKVYPFPPPKPSQLILYDNGMVTALDADDEQIPHYQGRFTDVAARLKLIDLQGCQFFEGVWGQPLTQISQEQFFWGRVRFFSQNGLYWASKQRSGDCLVWCSFKPLRASTPLAERPDQDVWFHFARTEAEAIAHLLTEIDS